MILSHRGYWLQQEEKNTTVSFERSFSLGFGTETDIRDFNGELVISHDIANKQAITLKYFFELYASFDKTLPLALNIKADGLQQPIAELLRKYNIENYFVFDMSIPDTIGYLKKGISFYTRQSEYETNLALYQEAQGVWIDEFNHHWIDDNVLKAHLDKGKNICIVSPELHKREYHKEWLDYKTNYNLFTDSRISICTDKPEEAKAFFYEN